MFTQETVREIASAAVAAGLEPAALLAVAEVESGGRVFATVAGRAEPLIRFEGHYFDRRLSGEKLRRARAEALAAPTAGAVKNPAAQAARWKMLEKARAIDAKAADESTSWGLGQVMGAHWIWLGYPSVQALVAEARSGAAGQARLMLRYIDKAGLAGALRRRDWQVFARGYNGPAYACHGYHLKLAAAYERHRRGSAGILPADTDTLRRGGRGEAVRELQLTLTALGFPLQADGVFGAATEAMVKAFQKENGLAADGIVGAGTRAALAHRLQPGSGGWLAALLARLQAWLGWPPATSSTLPRGDADAKSI